MQYITDLTSVPAKPSVPSLAGLTPGYFTEGLPGAATRVRGWWLNLLQDEIINVIKAANITLDANNETQLLQALQILIGRSGLAFTPVQQGGGTLQGNNKVYIGWDGGGLRATVDVTDEGRLAFQSWVLGLGYQTVTGHVATCDLAANSNEVVGQAFAVTGVNGTPNWVWGSNGNGTWQVYFPSQMSVAFAANAQAAQTAGFSTTSQHASLADSASFASTLSIPWLATQFPFNSGYIKFPGGLILTWGTIAVFGDSNIYTFNSPLTFPGQMFFAVGSFQASVPPLTGNFGIQPLSPSTFSACNSSNSGKFSQCNVFFVGA